MRVLVTADLHYDVLRSRGPAEALAEAICRQGGDALVLVGDTAGADTALLRECLGRFERFGGRKLLVPGNHCLWCRNGETSLDRYERVLPAEAAAAGFELLGGRPVVLGGVGLVGSVGWYDYSFREESLGIPEPFYRAKVAPGTAGHYPAGRRLLEEHGANLTAAQRNIYCRWMDGEHAKLPMADEEFVALLAERLARQLAELSRRVERIVAFVHHVPFRELLPTGRPPQYAFAAAYMGARRLGEVLRVCAKVRDVYCGHSHWPAAATIGPIRAVNVGSTYVRKRLEVFEP